MVVNRLKELEEEVRKDLEVLNYPQRSGVGRDKKHPEALNVAIIGGGQSGLAVAGALKRESLEGIEVFDQESEERVGPWPRFARMHTLRTPKNLPGPNQGIPNLTIPRWYDAVHGEGSWKELSLIPKEDWCSYLQWYRRVMDIPLRFETAVERIEWLEKENLFKLHLQNKGKNDSVLARQVVMATGIEGSGAWQTPAFIREALPRAYYAHTSEDIDFKKLKGKRVGVLGAGASAFDNASVSLEEGAASVDLCFRRKELVKQNTFRWSEYMGFLKHFPDLSDEDKWRFIHKILEIGQLPPRDTFLRANRFEEFHLCPDTPWEKVYMDEKEVVVVSKGKEKRYDFVIAATGFSTNLSIRKELQDFHNEILLWKDRYQPPEELENREMANHPYLGPNFEFLPKNSANSWISRIFNYTYGGIMSLGFGGASITGMKYSLPRIVYGLTRYFFLEEKEDHLQSLSQYSVEEF